MEHKAKDMIVKIEEETIMWAVMWGEIVVCLSSKKEWAEQIAWALDYAKPYSE